MMDKTVPTDQHSQRARLQQAVDLLGGPRSAAPAIGMGARHLTRLLAGGSPIHTGILADTARALVAHADACRQLERAISPAFAANLAPDQPAAPKPRGKWAHP